MTKKKNPSVFACALVINVIYYIICIIIYKINSDNHITNGIFFAFSIIVWFGIGFFYSKKTIDFSFSKGAKFIFLSFLPIILFMVAYNVLLNMNLSNDTYSWVLFYNIVAPLIFWIKPAVFLLDFFDIAFYTFTYAYIGILLIASIIGLLASQLSLHAKNKKRNKNAPDMPQKTTTEDSQVLNEAALSAVNETENEVITDIEFEKSLEDTEDISVQDDTGLQETAENHSIENSENEYDIILDQINFNELQNDYNLSANEKNNQSIEALDEHENENEK